MDTAETVARSVGGLAVVLGLVWIGVRLMRGRVHSTAQSQLRVVQRVAVGKKSAVALVQVADRCILVGVGENTITFLAEVAPHEQSGASPVTDEVPGPGARRRPAAPLRSSPAVPLQRSAATGLRGVLMRAQDRTTRR